MFDIPSIVRPNVRSLVPYRCARDDFKEGILLDANENTHGPALAKVSQWESSLDLNRYPDPHQGALKQQIVDFRNASPNLAVKNTSSLLSVDNLCLGVGSDESIDLLLRCVCTPGQDKLLVCPPTYGMYLICATINDVALVKVPLAFPGFQIDREAILSALSADKNIKLVYLTSPGNPTGQLIDVKEIVALLEAALALWSGFVVVDEAYIDFTAAGLSAATLVNQYPNLVVMQTLSKSFGLAGIRLGVTYATPELSRYLNSMKYPYNISSLTADVAKRATNSEGLKTMQSLVDEISLQREAVARELQKIEGVGRNIGGLDANFLLLEILDKDGNPSNQVAERLYNKLAVENQVVVRFRGKELNCTGALRISIGTSAENAELATKFKKCIQEVYQE